MGIAPSPRIRDVRRLTYMKTFDESIIVIGLKDASYFASQLFMESFATAFPVPRDNCGLPIPTPPANWHQYVALYRWAEDRIETVGFCNWIRFKDVYLEGGMCVRRDFYRRLPRDQWQRCKERGGVAEIMMRAAATELTDCIAWFGYCGDKKALIVDKRIGYETTEVKHLIAKWFRHVDPSIKAARVADVAAIGPF
jgi:hypothetical protein